MGQNEKIRTEDVVEILDGKILTSEGHINLSVNPRENYSSVLSKISSQILSEGQKEAFDSTLTTPSALNPVVLMNDLVTYVPLADLGEVKDSVATFAALPVPTGITGDSVEDSTTLTFLDTTGILSGSNVTSIGVQFAPNTVVVDVLSSTEVQIHPAATATAIGYTITFSPSEGDLRGVINDGIIYRWNGSAWVSFTRTGTMEHPELNNQNNDAAGLYRHLTLAEKTQLLAETHIHPNMLVLQAILSAGSGDIITILERNLLPSLSQKDALVGTSGTPSGTNPYVTHADPRLNTVRNPYVTIGPPGSLATFQGVDYRPFEDALLAIDIGTASTVKAIEVLPGSYNLSGVPLIWSTQTSSLLIEGFTPNSVVLSFQTYAPGVRALGPGTGPLILKGIVFELNDLGTSGIISERANTLIEDCVFRPGPTTSLNQLGITLLGENSVVRRCHFEGSLTKGIEVKAAGCRIENCTFDLTDPTNIAVDVYEDGDYTLVDHCTLTSGIVNVQALAEHVNVSNNRFYATWSALTGISDFIIDVGTATRYLENQPPEANQPFLGGKRTIGLLETSADFRGVDETPFIEAIADPNVIEIEVLDGVYTFASTVVIPSGMTIRGVMNGSDIGVRIEGASGVSLFELNSYTGLEDLYLVGDSASLVTADSKMGMRLLGCKFELTAVTDPLQFAFSGISNSLGVIHNCTFNGERGISLQTSPSMKLLSSVFNNTDVALNIEGDLNHIKDNIFHTTTAPDVQGDIVLVEENHFLGDLPTKLGTTNSIWQGNWPHPQANNLDGVDVYDLSLGQHLTPSSAGAEVSDMAETGTISFVEDIDSKASTLSIDLPCRLNKVLPYTVRLYWVCENSVVGDVLWRVTAVYRDRVAGQIGTFVTDSVVSTRTLLVNTDEDMAEIVFTNYGLVTDPTHVSFIVERIGSGVTDTLLADAHLVEVQVLLPRD